MKVAALMLAMSGLLVPAASATAIPIDQPTATHSAQDAQDRADQAARASRQGQRGGSVYWLDSGYKPVWSRVSSYARGVWKCIREHESISAGHYRAENPYSTASGAGQWIDSTWRGVAHWVKVDGRYVARKYSRAAYAPAWVQDAVFVHVYRHGGLSMWSGTYCAGT
jgi:hypothetical protein